MRVILIGLRGSGKTTVGQALARAMRCPFIDLDDLTPTMLGCSSAAEALTTKGEPTFRAAETSALKSVLETSPASTILALGGGTPTAPGAVELLQAQRDVGRAILFYFHASPDALRARLRSNHLRARPSLTGKGTLAEIDDIYARRDPLYRTLANHTIDVEHMSIDGVLTRVQTLLAPRS